MSYKFYFLHNHRTNFSQVFALITRVPIFFYLTGAVLCLATQSCLTLCDPMHCNLSGWGFSRQEYWSWLPCPAPGDLPNSVIELKCVASLALQVLTELPGILASWHWHIHKHLVNTSEVNERNMYKLFIWLGYIAVFVENTFPLCDWSLIMLMVFNPF